jgi:hypothetical protein
MRILNEEFEHLTKSTRQEEVDKVHTVWAHVYDQLSCDPNFETMLIELKEGGDFNYYAKEEIEFSEFVGSHRIVYKGPKNWGDEESEELDEESEELDEESEKLENYLIEVLKLINDTFPKTKWWQQNKNPHPIRVAFHLEKGIPLPEKDMTIYYGYDWNGDTDLCVHLDIPGDSDVDLQNFVDLFESLPEIIFSTDDLGSSAVILAGNRRDKNLALYFESQDKHKD